jgi:hypothetical protein
MKVYVDYRPKNKNLLYKYLKLEGLVTWVKIQMFLMCMLKLFDH